MSQTEIRSYFETLHAAWGQQHWWPADSPFEVIVGAILTQNTAWTNVEKALDGLRRAGVLTVDGVRRTPISDLETIIRPAGFFRQKAARLKRFIEWLDSTYHGSLEEMFRRPTMALREELLDLNGIGPETADSILLYAGQHEIFVVDAYTRRIFSRHQVADADAPYDEIRELVESALRDRSTRPAIALALPARAVEPGPGPAEETPNPTVHPPTSMSESPRSPLAQVYNEFHALIVQVAKHYCLSRIADCERCPLGAYLRPGQPHLGQRIAKPRR